MFFGCSKESSQLVLLSTHNICFGQEIREIIFKEGFLIIFIMSLWEVRPMGYGQFGPAWLA